MDSASQLEFLFGSHFPGLVDEKYSLEDMKSLLVDNGVIKISNGVDGSQLTILKETPTVFPSISDVNISIASHLLDEEYISSLLCTCKTFALMGENKDMWDRCLQRVTGFHPHIRGTYKNHRSICLQLYEATDALDLFSLACRFQLYDIAWDALDGACDYITDLKDSEPGPKDKNRDSEDEGQAIYTEEYVLDQKGDSETGLGDKMATSKTLTRVALDTIFYGGTQLSRYKMTMKFLDLISRYEELYHEAITALKYWESDITIEIMLERSIYEYDEEWCRDYSWNGLSKRLRRYALATMKIEEHMIQHIHRQCIGVDFKESMKHLDHGSWSREEWVDVLMDMYYSYWGETSAKPKSSGSLSSGFGDLSVLFNMHDYDKEDLIHLAQHIPQIPMSIILDTMVERGMYLNYGEVRRIAALSSRPEIAARIIDMYKYTQGDAVDPYGNTQRLHSTDRTGGVLKLDGISFLCSDICNYDRGCDSLRLFLESGAKFLEIETRASSVKIVELLLEYNHKISISFLLKNMIDKNDVSLFPFLTQDDLWSEEALKSFAQFDISCGPDVFVRYISSTPLIDNPKGIDRIVSNILRRWKESLAKQQHHRLIRMANIICAADSSFMLTPVHKQKILHEAKIRIIASEQKVVPASGSSEPEVGASVRGRYEPEVGAIEEGRSASRPVICSIVKPALEGHIKNIVKTVYLELKAYFAD